MRRGPVSKLDKDSYILSTGLILMEITQEGELITISSKAAEKVTEFIKQENKDKLYLRVYVSGGG